jgi:galactonate dehydratase
VTEERALEPVSRRAFVAAAATTLTAAPWIVRAQSALTLKFRTIPDPDGWAESLRLKGDWLVLEIGDGVLSGFGEASHSNDDERCIEVAAQLFGEHYRGFALSLESLARKEQEIAELEPDFVTATAFSGLNQALYDLLAKREQVPVWRLFRSGGAPFPGLPLYTTINRALRTRSAEEYAAIAAEVRAQGFATLKCAPFEAVNNAERAVEKAAAGLATLARLRKQFPDLKLRVDFHERFQPQDFFAIIPELERLELDWIEEPFAVGPSYDELRRRTRLRISGGELFWGRRRFAEIAERGWCDVIMPDVKHVGGFGPLLDVLKMTAGRIEVSPHNPSGPISTAASLHAAAVYPDRVRSLEYSFQRQPTRRATGEIVENGVLVLGDTPGWGVAPQ